MLSVCIITKNEAENLKECLKRLKQYNVEIVVVDTGSSDSSKEIAKEYTDCVYDFVWCDDFSAARNYASSKAQNDWIMMIDTDEFVEELDLPELELLIRKNEKKVGRIHRKNAYITDGMGMNSNELVNRIYDRRLFHYEGIIHEQIAALSGAEYETYPAPVYTTHSGYTGDEKEREKKAERNLSLLKKELEKDEKDSYILYQIGKAYFYKKDYCRAAEYFQRSIESPLNPRLEYVIDMVTSYGYALVNDKQPEKALALENVYDDFKEHADFVFMMGIVYMQNARFEQAINTFLAATKCQKCSVEGTDSYLAYYNAGVIYECLGEKQKAAELYRKCGSYSLAVQGLARCRKS